MSAPSLPRPAPTAVGDPAAKPAPARELSLARDLRVDLFAIVFALGTIHHEIEFTLEQTANGSLQDYMEKLSRVVPSPGWPSTVGLGLHVADVVIALLVILVPRRRELLSVLAVTFVLSQLASPLRIASHAGMMAAGLAVVLAFSLAEWADRLLHPSSPRERFDAWCRWTLLGLVVVCSLTYLFAVFYKLNPGWLSPDSSAARFVIRTLAPVLGPLGLAGAAQPFLSWPATLGTLVVELLLPPLLIWRRTRLAGVFIGLVFHSMMIVQGVVDFPTLILAFYPAFMTVDEVRELLRRGLSRPSPRRLIAAAVLGGYGGYVFTLAPQTVRFRRTGLPIVPPVVVAHSILSWLTLLGLVYLAVVVAGWLAESRRLPARPPASAEGDEGEREPRRQADWLGAGGWMRVGPVAPALAVLLTATFCYMNLGQFFSWPAVGEMSMYSGINPDRSNHLLLPLARGGHDGFDFVQVLSFQASGLDTREAREFQAFLDQLNEPDNVDFGVNLNFLRYQMNRVCSSAPDARVRLVTRNGDQRQSYDNVCRHPSMRHYLPYRMRVECKPDCGSTVGAWIRRGLDTGPSSDIGDTDSPDEST